MIKENAEKEAVEYGYESADTMIDEVGKTTYRMYILQGMVIDKLMDLVKVEPIAEAATETTTAE